MNVMELFKKTVAFGIGAAMFSAEKLKAFADEMVAKGEMTSDEANKFVDEMTKRADEEKRSLQDWMREQMSRMLHQAGAAESTRVAALEARVATLERRVAELTGSPDTSIEIDETEEVDTVPQVTSE